MFSLNMRKAIQHMKKKNLLYFFTILVYVLSPNFIFAQLNTSKKSATKNTPFTTFELFIKDENNQHSTKVFYIEGKTTGFDNGYDSKMFGEANYDLAIFTKLITENVGNKIAIQTLPNENYENMVIPVGIIGKSGYEIKFSVESLNFPKNLNISLEDRTNNLFINLYETEYTIILTSDTD